MSSKSTVDADHPAKPGSLGDIRKPSWGYVLRKTVREFLDDQCTDLAAALTYYAILSLFPALIALASILSLVGQGQSTQTIIDMASEFIPQESMERLQPILESITSVEGAGWGLFLGLLVALWTASNYVNAFSRAMNRMYEVPEGRPIWKLRPVMYLLTLAMLILVAMAAVILVVSGPVAEAIGGLMGLGDQALLVWGIAKWPVLLLIVVVTIALLYYVTPNVQMPKFRWVSPGALIAIVVAALAALALGLYVSAIGGESYGETYGALAGVIIFLLLLWILNLALLFGAEFDAELERGRQLQAGIPAEESVQLPPRDTRASDKKAEKAEEDIEKGRALRISRGRTQDLDETSAKPEDVPAKRDRAARRRHDDE
ncbi:YihY/virulence factor BrkB family protein [Georgenia sp. EYE_87]|uniref:YihY/virulence factor BrkB family protein n=1 Tax=Georgenia sp. EYE_87 TaxID=2853448 RepID=UPI002003C03B|nr:YihY/virulence factor BrkB family protein [Georgenia sp. EYE_87]MCK6211183.1 YihY/virulence factor BrkB family protein [Georgenia sp. EYE_87]